jgi:ABC-type transport system involved in Fe-S cluster assembly fused permease/ATPase subunit
LSTALSTAMVLSSYGVMSGALTIGDLVILYVKHLFFVSSMVAFLISEIVKICIRKTKSLFSQLTCVKLQFLPIFFSL